MEPLLQNIETADLPEQTTMTRAPVGEVFYEAPSASPLPNLFGYGLFAGLLICLFLRSLVRKRDYLMILLAWGFAPSIAWLSSLGLGFSPTSESFGACFGALISLQGMIVTIACLKWAIKTAEN